MKHQSKFALTMGALSLVTVFAYQNCSNVNFSGADMASSGGNTITEVEQPIVVTPTPTPSVPPVIVDPGPVASKISCSVSSLPSVKPSGFVYSANNGFCVPASGNGPSYQFTITCDADLPSDPMGIRIQYNMNFFNKVTNATAMISNSNTYYRGRSFYKPEVNPTSSPSIVYGLNNIRKTGARSVVAQADFFFIDGFPADATTHDCNNLRSMDLNLFIWVNKGGVLQHFNDNAAKITLQ